MPGKMAAASMGETMRPALFLDIDGTLIEHHPHPEGVAVDDGCAAC